MNTRIFAIMNTGEGATENLTIDRGPFPTPNTEAGKAMASRNATTHGLFARDVVLPSLGEDPDGYRQLEGAWTTRLVPQNLLEQHYVEKIAAASWRLRRLHPHRNRPALHWQTRRAARSTPKLLPAPNPNLPRRWPPTTHTKFVKTSGADSRATPSE